MQIAMTATISLGLFVVGHAAFAEDTASFAKIDVVYHSGTNTLDVTGIVYKTFSQNYALTIFDPQGRLIVVSQLQLSQDDAFSQSIIPSSALWSESGNYTVKLASGPAMLSEKSFYFSGISCCIPNSHGVQASLPGTTNMIDSPLKQFKSGIAAKDVTCRQGLQLIFKFEDSSPVCVSEQTGQTLVEHGWACNTLSHSAHTVIRVQTMNVTNSNLSVNYTITNAKILDIKADTRSVSIIINMQASGDGNLDIVIPRTLVEYPHSQMDPHLFVLGNGQEIDSREINPTSNERTLSIPFKADINQIEIIGSTCCT